MQALICKNCRDFHSLKVLDARNWRFGMNPKSASFRLRPSKADNVMVSAMRIRPGRPDLTATQAPPK